jgi:hypothetical protein
MTTRQKLFGLGLFGLLPALTGCLNNTYHTYRGFAGPSVPLVAIPKFAQEAAAESHFFYWPMPVSPALSHEIEELLERWEKEGVPILGPIRGEFAPVFCMDPPSEQEIYEALSPIPHGLPFLYEMRRNNVRISYEKIVDQIDECRFFPLAGPCQLHHCHFKCTIWYDQTITMDYPIPFSYTDHKMQVVYIDKDHLHRCGEPGHMAPPGGPGAVSRY